MKKAQVSIFVIIGIILLIISAILVYRFNDRPVIDNPEDDFEEIELYVQDCLQQSAVEAIELLGKQGSLDPSAYVASDDTKISYYYFKGKGYVPDQQDIEKQISQHMRESAYECINDFSDKEYVIDAEIIDISSSIEEDYVIINLDSPIKIYHHGTKDEIIIPEVELQANLKKIYDTTQEIIKDTIQDPEWIQFDKLYENDLDIKIVKVNSSTLVYVITDNKVGLDKKPFIYRFAVKYDL